MTGVRIEENVPISHDNSPIIQRLLHGIIPPPHMPPRLQNRKPLIEIPLDERQQRENRQQNLRHKRRHYGSECRRKTTLGMDILVEVR